MYVTSDVTPWMGNGWVLVLLYVGQDKKKPNLIGLHGNFIHNAMHCNLVKEVSQSVVATENVKQTRWFIIIAQTENVG